MKKLILLATLFISATSFAQIEQLIALKNSYNTFDSISKLGIVYSPDSLMLKKVKQLDKEHPSEYFNAVGKLINELKYNDAAFLYYVGVLRYKYYNAVNPDYQASGDGALLGSLKYVMGEPINMYLKTNIDNFILILKLSGEYFTNNDYEFYSKTKNIEKYNTLAKGYDTLIKDMETNKEKYKTEWEAEKKVMIENIDKAIEEYNNLTPEEKKKLKDGN